MSIVLTLYQIEENLAALIDTADMVDAPEQRAEIEAEICQALATAVEKRDACGGFLTHCTGRCRDIAEEIERLTALQRRYQRAIDRMNDCIKRTILELGPDDHGRYRKLEGKTNVFSIRKQPDAVEITDEAAVYSAYKTLTIKLPALAWEEILDGLDIDERAELLAAVKRVDCEVSKTAVKQALDAGDEVPGARWRETAYRVVRS